MQFMKLLGQPLIASDFGRHGAKLQYRLTVINSYTALGIPVTEAFE